MGQLHRLEEHLHAECRSFLYYAPPSGQTSPVSAYDSADRLLSYQRGVMHSDAKRIDQRPSLPEPQLGGDRDMSDASSASTPAQQAHEWIREEIRTSGASSATIATDEQLRGFLESHLVEEQAKVKEPGTGDWHR